MVAITILNSANVPVGPFTREQIADKLKSGEITLESLAFVAGLSQWTPLRDVLAKVDAAPASIPVPPIAPPVSTAQAYSYAVTMQPPPHLVYAGFWLRVAAYLIDSLIISVPFIIILMFIGLLIGGVALVKQNSLHDFSGNSTAAQAAIPIGIILFDMIFIVGSIVGTWLYFALLESGVHQATFGKRVMSIKVTDMAGQRISFAHASGRFFGKIVTGMIPLGIGYIMAGFTERKQALHDLIAGTLVVRR